MLLTFTQWLQATGFFTYLRGSSYTYPVVLALHMVVLAFFGGLILMTDLRILGVGLKNYSVSEIVGKTRTAKKHGLILMLILGFLLFGCKAEEYYYNAFFKMKLALLFLVLINWLIFHGSVYDKPAELDQTPTPGKAKLAAGLSLFLWVSILCCGRGIGYIEPPLEKLHAQAAPGVSAGPGESPAVVALYRKH
jgi:hypothetical protein